MIRIAALYLFLFSLPFIVYAAYVYLARRSVPSGGVFEGAPYFWLIGSGLVIAIATFVAFAAFTGSEPGGIYQPAELRDGKLVPGRIVPPGGEAANEP